MPPDETRKRKAACQSCTRSKAKCSPFEDRRDLCYRCQRLGKECVFEETLRKRVPKSRSRVKQLEQRVDTLINLLAVNGQQIGDDQRANSVSHLPTPQPRTAAEDKTSPQSAVDIPETAQQSPPYITPVDTPSRDCVDEEPFNPYDPVEAGVLTRERTSQLLKEFSNSFVQSFPFVVIPVATDSDSLRLNSPFLFLAIMTVTSYQTPPIQRVLAKELKEQIASRIIRNSHKSLEILQGLLVYAGWYHFFFNPLNQQMAIVVQLCVAMVQDLNLSKSPKEKTRRLTKLEEQSGMILNTDRLSAERRAFLGAYYVNAGFAQAWRKQSTMRHTRYMVQCCQLLAQRKEHPSDVLITSMIELSELICRINDYFSYDDIDNTEVNGEIMLKATTLSFRNELDQIRNSIPIEAKNNKSLYLGTCLVEIWVYECALHGTFWTVPSSSKTSTISITRTVALNHCLHAMNAYLNTLIGIPQDMLHSLAFPSWSGWFYAIIVACKLVFLEDNERHSQTDLDSVSREVDKLAMHKYRTPRHYEPYTLPSEVNTTSIWDPIVVAKEAGVQSIFDQFMRKMEFTIPSNPDACENKDSDFDPLFCMVVLQHSFLDGFTKRMKEHSSKLPSSKANTTAGTQCMPNSHQDLSSAMHVSGYDSQSTMTPQARFMLDQCRTNPIPLMNSFHFNSINFDSIAPLDSYPPPQLSQDDMLWDTVMGDFAMRWPS